MLRTNTSERFAVAVHSLSDSWAGTTDSTTQIAEEGDMAQNNIMSTAEDVADQVRITALMALR